MQLATEKCLVRPTQKKLPSQVNFGSRTCTKPIKLKKYKKT